MLKPEGEGSNVIKRFPWFAIVLSLLAAYAVYAAPQALHRGERMASIVMLFIAVLFIKALQKRA